MVGDVPMFHQEAVAPALDVIVAEVAEGLNITVLVEENEAAFGRASH